MGKGRGKYSYYDLGTAHLETSGVSGEFIFMGLDLWADLGV